MAHGFDPIFPDDLARLHPLTCDEDTAFQESGHRYAIRVQNSWTSEGLVSVTGWIKTYVPEEKTDFFAFAAMRTAKSINQKFLEAVERGAPYPEELYDKVDRADWEGAARCQRHQSTAAAEFGARILGEPRFVRLPYNRDVDEDLRNNFTRWRDLEPKTLEAFAEIFGPYEPRVLALPPFLTGNDVRDLWPRFGTRFHHDAEHYLNGHAPTYTQAFPEWRQFLNFVELLKAKGHAPYRTELTMSVPALMLCGQADFVARKEDGTYVLYDWKRTASIRADGRDPYTDKAPQMLPPWAHRKATSRSTYEIQLNVYRQMLMTYGLEVGELYLVCFHRDFDDFQLVPVPVIKAGSDTPDARALRQMVADRKRAVAASM